VQRLPTTGLRRTYPTQRAVHPGDFEPDEVYATAVDYGAITPLLVQAIKEQQKQIEQLKAKIDELKKIER
jgi:hypothetical protein